MKKIFVFISILMVLFVGCNMGPTDSSVVEENKASSEQKVDNPSEEEKTEDFDYEEKDTDEEESSEEEVSVEEVNMLVGKWVDEDSFIEFYSDGRGYMSVYLKGEKVQDVLFRWSDWSNPYGHFLTISEANDYLNKDYSITVTASKLTLKGYLAFGKPQVTTWYKTNY